jgi:putative phage-type endonuclease
MSAQLVPTSSEAEWLDARRKGVTASEIATVMGLSPWDSPYALYHRKLGILPAQADAAPLERGRDLEPIIVRKFAEAHPDILVSGTGRDLYASSERPWQLATPDRLININRIAPGLRVIGTEGSLLEAKSDAGSDEWGEPGTDEIPVQYRAQAIWQADVMGVRRVHVACLRVREWDVREYVVEMDDSAKADLELMLKEARDFLDRIDLREAPDVDWRPATAAAIRGLYPDPGEADVLIGRQLAISYRAAVRRFKEAEQRKDEMANRVLAAVGGGRRAVLPSPDPAGEPVATRSVSYPKRIDIDTLRRAYPDVAAKCTPEPRAVVKLLPAKPKKDKKHVSTDSE